MPRNIPRWISLGFFLVNNSFCSVILLAFLIENIFASIKIMSYLKRPHAVAHHRGREAADGTQRRRNDEANESIACCQRHQREQDAHDCRVQDAETWPSSRTPARINSTVVNLSSLFFRLSSAISARCRSRMRPSRSILNAAVIRVLRWKCGDCRGRLIRR